MNSLEDKKKLRIVKEELALETHNGTTKADLLMLLDWTYNRLIKGDLEARGMNVLEKILEEMKKIKDGNRKEKLYGKYPPQNKRQETLNAYSQGYEDGTDNFYNAIIPIIRSHMDEASDMHGKRLIDANALDEEVRNFFLTIIGDPSQAMVVRECKESFRKMIDEQPTVHVIKE